jgi:hypothetical protein
MRVYSEGMRARVCCLALAIGLVPATAFAQDGLRSASLPERSFKSTLTPPREDRFLARPETYRPDSRRVRVPPFGFGFLGPQLFYPAVQPAIQPIIVVIPREAIEPARVAVPPAPVAPPAPYVAGLPGRPKTFYMIPGCYAGDRPPEPESLTPGCSISRLRAIPPRP